LEMDSTKLTKRSCLIIGLVTVLTGGIFLFSGCAEPTLGEAQIVVYERGEKTILDPKSPYFKKLQLTCEVMLTSSTTFLAEIKTLPDPEEVKSKEWAIELTYSEPVMVDISRRGGTTALPDVGVGGYQLLIPLTGKLTYLESTLEDRKIGNKYMPIFLLPEEMGFPSQIIEGEAELVGTKKDVEKIRDILTRFDINVP